MIAKPVSARGVSARDRTIFAAPKSFVFAVQKRRKKCAQKFPGTLSPGRERPPSPTSRQNGARRRDRREFKSYRTIFFSSSSSSSEAFLRVVVFGAPRQRKFSKEEQTTSETLNLKHKRGGFFFSNSSPFFSRLFGLLPCSPANATSTRRRRSHPTAKHRQSSSNNNTITTISSSNNNRRSSCQILLRCRFNRNKTSRCNSCRRRLHLPRRILQDATTRGTPWTVGVDSTSRRRRRKIFSRNRLSNDRNRRIRRVAGQPCLRERRVSGTCKTRRRLPDKITKDSEGKCPGRVGSQTNHRF